MAKVRAVAKAKRLLPDDAVPGEEAALKYFVRHDPKIAAAWWFFCVWCAEHKPAFSRQLEQLAARMGQPVTHVDGILAALRFLELSMSSDPAFAGQWRAQEEQVPHPDDPQWGDLQPLVNRLAERERRRLARRRPSTPMEKELSKKRFRRATGVDYDAWVSSFEQAGLTHDEVFTMIANICVRSEARKTASALIMWAAAPDDSRIMILADLALPKRPAS